MKTKGGSFGLAVNKQNRKIKITFTPRRDQLIFLCSFP